MGLFSKPEVVVLKESSDAKDYLEKLETLRKEVVQGTDLANTIDREIAITKAGIAGEEAIMFELKNSGMDLVVLHDIYIETSDGRGAQIDYIVITPYVNVLIECKNLFGNIEINNKGEFIRSFFYGGHWIKEGIYSPITQNERHLTVYKDCKSETKGFLLRFVMEKTFNKYNKSIVVLANPRTVIRDRYAPKEIKQKVIRGDQLIAILKEFKSDAKSSKKEMLDIGERILAMNRDDRKEYISRLQKFVDEDKQNRNTGGEAAVETAVITNERDASMSNMDLKGNEINSQSSIETAPLDVEQVCPRCGKKLVVRTAKKGVNAGQLFYGCSGFPRCRYTKPY